VDVSKDNGQKPKPAKKKAVERRPKPKRPTTATQAKRERRAKPLPLGEQEAEHRVLVHLPVHIFGKRVQIEKAIAGMLHTLSVQGYRIDDEAFYTMEDSGPTHVKARAPGKVVDGS
jgi:hypothetical protein